MTVGSELKTVVQKTEGFLGKFAKEFQRLFKAAPSVLAQVNTFVNFASPLVLAIEQEVDPKDAPQFSQDLNIVKSDLATLSTAAQSEATAGSAAQAVTNLEQQLPALLQAGEIKDAATQAKVSSAVTLIGGELEAIGPVVSAWLNSLKSSSAGSSTAPAMDPSGSSAA